VGRSGSYYVFPDYKEQHVANKRPNDCVELQKLCSG